MTGPLRPLSPTMYVQLGMVMRGHRVRAKLAEVADKVGDRAKSLAEASDADANVTRTDGTRPGDHARDHAARPFSRISVDGTMEHGGPGQTRLRVLGRAVAEL